MDKLSISDIMWNLNSGFREMSFKDAELILIEREQRLKTEVVEMQEKYNVVLKENDALKKKCDWLQKESKEDTLQRRELRDQLRAKESEVKRAQTKIRSMETDNTTAYRKAIESVRREKEAMEENARLILKIKGLEEEKAEGQREIEKLLQTIGSLEKEKAEAQGKIEQLLQKIGSSEKEKAEAHWEIEKLLQKIGSLEKEKENALSDTQDLNNIFDRFKGRVDSLTKDSSLNLNSAYYGGDEDEDGRLITKIKQEYDEQSISPLKVPGTSKDPSLMVSDIGTIALKRRRDSSGCSSCRVVSDASWRFEADMLTAIETNPILAMEAVCVLYRQHKSDALKNRGFHSLHVLRGTALAEFLLNGDRQGDMKKSLGELQLFDPKALHDCKEIARTHSSQLFEIYQRQDDPFFGPK